MDNFRRISCKDEKEEAWKEERTEDGDERVGEDKPERLVPQVVTKRPATGPPRAQSQQILGGLGAG